MPTCYWWGQTCRWEMAVMPQHVVTVTEVLELHVALDIQYLKTGSSSIPMCQRLRPRAAASFAEAGDIPWVRFGMDDVGSKLELIRPHGMAMVVHQVRPASQLLLLLPLGHRVRSAFIKVCAYFPYPVGFQKSA
jgi:hypothetical protein